MNNLEETKGVDPFKTPSNDKEVDPFKTPSTTNDEEVDITPTVLYFLNTCIIICTNLNELN